MRAAVRSQRRVGVHLASRDVLTIAGLRQLLKPCSFIAVTGVSEDEQATLSALDAEQPDILLLNAGSESEVQSIVPAARGRHETLRVVVLADERLAEKLHMTVRPRLEGVLVRGGDYLQDIGPILRVVRHGGHVTSFGMDAGQTDGHPAINADVVTRLGALSIRESVILRELARGRTNSDIAQHLHVSVATVKADLNRIMNTMKAFSRVDLAVLAVQSGLIDV